jgi:hypothetical protein
MRSILVGLPAAFALAACSTITPPPPMAAMPASCPAGGAAPTPTDRDADGLDDAAELMYAQRYLPYLSLSPDEDCPTMGIIVRVTPHPTAGFVQLLYDVLYNDDCGIGGHIGDDERFGMTIDPAQPPPGGIVALKAISHKGTVCAKTSACGRCAGLTACQTLPRDGTAWPAVFIAKDKHGNYVDGSETCAITSTCLDQCATNPTPAMPPIVNVGEPCHPLVSNLTTEGFITTQAGWTHSELLNYDPWGTAPFGGGDVLASDLTEPDFATPACP